MANRIIPPEGWIKCGELKLDDVVIMQTDGLEYFVFDIIEEEFGRFIFFSSFDFRKNCSGFLIRYNDSNYFRILNTEDEQDLSHRLLEDYLSTKEIK